MDTARTLVTSMVPLYALVFLGFIAHRKLKIEAKALSTLLVYILAPIVTFHAAATTPLSFGALSLPVLFLVLALISSALFFVIGGVVFGKTASKRFLLAATAGSGNAGYFGLGLALVLFSPGQVNLVVLSILGFIAFMHTFGFYLTARGKFTSQEALTRLLHLPVMYAFMLGLLVHTLPIPLGQQYTEVMSWFKGSYTVLGMMVVGLSVSTIGGQVFDKTFTLLSLAAKFIVWPLLAMCVLLLNKYLLHWYGAEAQEIIWLLSIVPIATNTVTYATLLDVNSDVSAVSVLISTIVAIVYIPLVWPLVLWVSR